MNKTKLIILPMLLSFSITFSVLAGEEKECKWCDEESIKVEIGYLAKKLLDLSGEDTYSVEIKAYMKPFIGVCMQPIDKGIELTCITPGSQAEKNGLKTGDIITKMNDQDLQLKSDKEAHKKESLSVIKKMKTGDLIKMIVDRAGESIELDVTVGALSHPGYKLTVTK